MDGPGAGNASEVRRRTLAARPGSGHLPNLRGSGALSGHIWYGRLFEVHMRVETMKRWLALSTITVLSSAVAAVEGMWTIDNFPRAVVLQKYKVQIGDDWLKRVQRSVVRLETGCTGSIVSPEGLVLTNNHCVQSCLADNSSPTRDLIAGGFHATSRAEEMRCQGEQVSVLTSTENITPAVMKALAGVTPADATRTRNETITRLEAAC